MKAISLWEPWATAIALGLKQYETRGWSTSIRGTIAIHAAQKKECSYLIRGGGVIARAFEEKGIVHEDQLNFGRIVCLVDLVDCVPTDRLSKKISALEKAFGDYTPGRFAWKLENVRAFERPPLARGAQGFWNWNEVALIGGNTR